MRTHYPRTPHLPWSPGATSDDVRVGDLAGLTGREVVVTEKLDGENTTLYPDGLHARSLDSAHHPSRAWVKALHGRIARSIPPGWRVCGENMYARHSIGYADLESWFYAFSVWDGDRCLDWDRTVRFTRRLGIPVPPVLWRGTFDLRALRALRLDTARQEGYVVRTVDGFAREEFPARVAKWVRRGHVVTDTHWMLAPVVANGLSPAAALWDVRSGASADVPSLLTALAMTPADLARPATPDPDTAAGPDAVGPRVAGLVAVERGGGAVEGAEAAVVDVSARLDLLGRSGDVRLAGVLATLLHGTRRSWLGPRLVAPLGMPLARRIADLVGLHAGLHRRFPDEERRAGLVRLAVAADLGVLHAVAAAVLVTPTSADRVPAGHTDADVAAVLAGHTHPAAAPVAAGHAGARGRAEWIADAREQVEWSALYAEDAGLLGEVPLEPLRAGLRRALGDRDADVADRCWAAAREAYALGRITTVEEAVALTWRWRSGEFPRLVVMVGPSGSGKSTFAAGLPGVAEIVSLDDLRQARGSRSDQRANATVLRTGLDRLDSALAGGGTVVWDATALNQHQRATVSAVARRRDALITHAVLLIEEDDLARRNADRAYPVPPGVLAAQLGRFCPPYPGEAHRTWYVGPGGTVDDVAGALGGGDC